MVAPINTTPKTKKEKRKAKEKIERGPVLGNFDVKPTIMTSLRPPIREKKGTRKLTVAEKKLLRKKKHAEKKKVVNKLKKKAARPVFVLPKLDENDKQSEDEASEKIPPINFKVNTKTKNLDVRVTLHKCPHKFINLEPNPTHFIMDTLKWTRKYEVEMRYPNGIVVDPRAATAKFDHDILHVSLPITEFPKPAKQKQAKVSASIREAKRLRFVQARGGELVGMRKVAPKERKRKRDEDDVDLSIPAHKRKKKFVVDKNVLSEMADIAAAKQEEAIAAKQQQMGQVEAYFKERREAKIAKKAGKEVAKEKTLDQIVEREQKRVATLPDPGLDEKPALSGGRDARASKKKVSFASTNEVVNFGGGTGDGKKKGKRSKPGKNAPGVVEYKD